MDARRAHEIVSASDFYDVVYNNDHIYIQTVNEQKGTANIYHLSNPDYKEEVSLENLIEH